MARRFLLEVVLQYRPAHPLNPVLAAESTGTFMGGHENKEEIAARINPILDKVSVEGLKAWLKAIGFQVPVLSRTTITDFIAGLIAGGQLAEGALEVALIGFEEASDMRMYLLQLDEADIKAAKLSGCAAQELWHPNNRQKEVCRR